MAEKVVVFGASKMAEMVHFYLSNDSQHQVVAFTVGKQYLQGDTLWGLPLVAFEDIEDSYPPDEYAMFIAVGYKGLNKRRADLFKQAKEKGYRLVSYISSKATHWGDTKIGENCLILENQVIQPFVSIGDDVVLWSGNHFGHNVVIEDHAWISSHVVASGGVQVGSRTFIGVNVTLRDNVKIGRDCIIGAGAIILNNCPDESVYVAKATERYRLDSPYFERMMDISE